MLVSLVAQPVCFAANSIFLTCHIYVLKLSELLVTCPFKLSFEWLRPGWHQHIPHIGDSLSESSIPCHGTFPIIKDKELCSAFAILPDCQVLSFSVLTVQYRQCIVRCFIVHIVAIFSNSQDCQKTFELVLSHGRRRKAAEAAKLCTLTDLQPVVKTLFL